MKRGMGSSSGLVVTSSAESAYRNVREAKKHISQRFRHGWGGEYFSKIYMTLDLFMALRI
jgi:hypothetical protein